MNRILINALSASTGGGLTYATSLVPLLRKSLPSSIVLCSRGLGPVFSEESGTIQVQKTWIGGSRRFLWEEIYLGKLIEKHAIQVLYTPYQVAIQPRGIKSVCALRNLEPFFAPQYQYSPKSCIRNALLRFLTRISLARADRVIAVSDFALEFAANSLRVPRKKLVRVYHGRKESLLENDIKTNERIRRKLGIISPYVFTAGSILPYRRVEDIISAFEESLAPMASDAMLIIAGAGTDKCYRKKIYRVLARSRYRERISMIGYLTPVQMNALYHGCRMFISASEVEACPNIGIEAMTTGCSVIAAKAGPAEEIYGNGAMFFSTRAVTELGELMATLWLNETLNRQMSILAVKRSKMFSWEACARQTVDVLESI